VVDRLQEIISSAWGKSMHQWASDLFPICRSLTGEGVRETLRYFQKLLPGLVIHEVPSGTQAFDWTVPNEWNIREAWIEDSNGNRIVDFANHNLHVMGYSAPVNQVMELEELQEHLYSLPDQPDYIPYITSYYKERWGFCLTHRQRQQMKPGKYRVYIDSTLAPGYLNYGELVLPGQTKDEILLSTYVCHPSMANNELSGPVLACALAQWLQSDPRFVRRRHTYRILFLVETIGSIVFLSRGAEHLKRNLKAGFVLTCVGDDRDISFLPSRLGSTLADRVALNVLENHTERFTRYSFLDRGSDERQYCSPNMDLPVVSIMRSKYGEYPEYHTSGDDLSLITPDGLYGALRLHAAAISILEQNDIYRLTVMGEPQLGKRGLYPTISTKESGAIVRDMMNVIAYCDGRSDILQVAQHTDLSALRVVELMKPLIDAGLLEKVT
jgi:aminopeptidase-like protein